MAGEYTAGCAFIVEGETEKEFYLSFLTYLAGKHSAQIIRDFYSNDVPDVIYRIVYKEDSILVKFHTVNAITQIPRSGAWFNTQCLDKYKIIPWNVFLCYDTDKYLEDISKFYKDDWKLLRQDLKKASVLDVAAAADIEDVMLTDLVGVCRFIGCEVPSGPIAGRKGKVKLKNLFRDHNLYYHEGKRARPLIDALNMQLIMDNSGLPLQEMEHWIFK